MLVGYEKVIASEQVCISDAHLWNKTVKFFPLQGCDGQIRYDFWLCCPSQGKSVLNMV